VLSGGRGLTAGAAAGYRVRYCALPNRDPELFRAMETLKRFGVVYVEVDHGLGLGMPIPGALRLESLML
jgi:hypothetical protein